MTAKLEAEIYRRFKHWQTMGDLSPDADVIRLVDWIHKLVAEVRAEERAAPCLACGFADCSKKGKP